MDSLKVIRTRGCKGSRGHHGPWDEWEHGLWALCLRTPVPGIRVFSLASYYFWRKSGLSDRPDSNLPGLEGDCLPTEQSGSHSGQGPMCVCEIGHWEAAESTARFTLGSKNPPQPSEPGLEPGLCVKN